MCVKRSRRTEVEEISSGVDSYRRTATSCSYNDPKNGICFVFLFFFFHRKPDVSVGRSVALSGRTSSARTRDFCTRESNGQTTSRRRCIVMTRGFTLLSFRSVFFLFFSAASHYNNITRIRARIILCGYACDCRGSRRHFTAAEHWVR